MRGSPYPPELKSEIIAALLAGSTVSEICGKFEVPQSTVSSFKAELPKDIFDSIRLKKGERLDELVYQCLVRNLTALDKQAEIASDPEYIRKQPAGELATLYGVMADKTLRLLTATTGQGVEPKQIESGE